MKLMVIVNDRSAVATIRLLSPIAQLEREGILTSEIVTLEKPQTFDLARLDDQDLLVFQRTYIPDTLEILRHAQLRGKKTVYDIDDDLLGIPQSHPLFDFFNRPGVQHCIEEFVRKVDHVTVSTRSLKERMTSYNHNITVIQNYLDTSIFPTPRGEAVQKPCRIGYAGGWTHEADFQQVLPALEEIRSEYRTEVSLVFFWYIPSIYKGNPEIEYIGGTEDLTEFGRKLNKAALDIGLAPLAATQFNEAKSDEKFLEYASQRTAGIYSYLEPYQGSVIDGHTGIYVKGADSAEWYEKIKYLIDNSEKRRQIQEQAYEYVTNQRNVVVGAREIAQLYSQILAGSSPIPELGFNAMVSIIILTHNAVDYTRRCVDSIQQHTNYPHEIIFVDNGSTDGTKDYLRSIAVSNPNCRLIDNETNLGFAAGNNQGVSAARGAYVLLLNNDVIVGDGWLESLVNALERDERIGLVGPITNYISGRQRLADIPYKSDAEYFGFAATVRTANRGKVTPRRRIAGFAILTRKSLYDELGGLDEDFGSGNFEDDDFCLRAREKGYAIMVDESTYLHHFGSRSFVENRIDYGASLKRNEKLFRTKWPDVDLDWLLETDEPLSRVLDRKAKEAIELVHQGDLEGGAKLCREVLEEDPTKVEAVHGFGLIAHLSGNLREARNHYERAVSLNRDWSPAQQSLALLDMVEGDLNSAQVRLAKVLEANPRDLEARRLLGQSFLEAEQFEEGISLLMGILQDDPNDWQTHFILASLYAEVDRQEDMRRHLEAVLAANPDHAQAREMLAKSRKKN
ncbi:MAG: glycosyltransferase [Fidelibacterota bacterium]|nr:MAG: glycosyltransferase [Candidatus Neomarinimicrobiota bacterium]